MKHAVQQIVKERAQRAVDVRRLPAGVAMATSVVPQFRHAVSCVWPSPAALAGTFSFMLPPSLRGGIAKSRASDYRPRRRFAPNPIRRPHKEGTGAMKPIAIAAAAGLLSLAMPVAAAPGDMTVATFLAKADALRSRGRWR
jgi:hypothetical protein